MVTTLQNRFFNTRTSFFNQSLFILFGVITLAIASQLAIPLEPVPLTFQSTGVVLLGLCMGSKRASAAVALYLLAGALGLPVFAEFKGGLPILFGPTSGYLLGFLPAAMLSGYLAEKGFAKNYLSAFVAACLGVSIIFAAGVSVLSNFTGSWALAVTFGFKPFIVTELIKLAVVAMVVPRCWSQAKND